MNLIDFATNIHSYRHGAGSSDIAFLAAYSELSLLLEGLSNQIPPSVVPEALSPTDFAKEIEAAISRMKAADLRRRQELQAKHNPSVSPNMDNLIRRANGEMLD